MKTRGFRSTAVGIFAIASLIACNVMGGTESRIPKVGETVRIAPMAAHQVNALQRSSLNNCVVSGLVIYKGETYWVTEDNIFLILEPVGNEGKTTCKDGEILVRKNAFRSAIEAEAERSSIEATRAGINVWKSNETPIPTPTRTPER